MRVKKRYNHAKHKELAQDGKRDNKEFQCIRDAGLSRFKEIQRVIHTSIHPTYLRRQVGLVRFPVVRLRLNSCLTIVSLSMDKTDGTSEGVAQLFFGCFPFVRRFFYSCLTVVLQKLDLPSIRKDESVSQLFTKCLTVVYQLFDS